MKTITIHNMAWRVWSPSLLELVGHPLVIAFDGRSWLIGVRDVYGLKEFSTRDEAARLISESFATAQSAG